MKRTIIAAAILTAAVGLTACSSTQITMTDDGKIEAMTKVLAFGDIKTVIDDTHAAIDHLCEKMKSDIEKLREQQAATSNQSQDPHKTWPGIPSEELTKVVEVAEKAIGMFPENIYIWSGRCK